MALKPNATVGAVARQKLFARPGILRPFLTGEAVLLLVPITNIPIVTCTTEKHLVGLGDQLQSGRYIWLNMRLKGPHLLRKSNLNVSQQ